jgi:uncharacterized membrane protein
MALCYSRERESRLLKGSRMSVAQPAVRQSIRWVGTLRGWEWAFLAAVVAPLLVFLALPWPLEGKSLAVLHGLCAQQPTHSYYFDGQRLPFDARMTGIYSGFAVSALFLLARGRWRAAGWPSLGVLLTLGGGVLALGLDGLNSTLLDMRFWHAYAPRNEYRLATGLLTGAALAVFVGLLLGQLALAPTPRRRERLVRDYRELAGLLLALAATGALIATRWGPLRVPLTLVLLLSAVAALTTLLLAFVLLFTRRENRARLTRELAGPATAALLAAYAVIAFGAGGRFLLELVAGVPTTRGG